MAGLLQCSMRPVFELIKAFIRSVGEQGEVIKIHKIIGFRKI